MNIRLIFNLFLLLMGLGARLAAQNDKAVIDRVVAMVGSEIILLSDVEEQFAYIKQQQPTVTDDYRCIALQNIIVQKLLVNQAKLDSIEVKDEEIDNQIDARIDRLLSYFNQDQKALEDYYKETLDEIKMRFRPDILNQLLSERMQESITSKATITPAEVKRFYNDIPKDSLPYFNAEVEIREILYKPLINPEERSKAQQRAEELRKQILEGANFAELAKKYSDDTGSGLQGGDLGWQKRGTFVSEFEATVYKLEKGQISQVVETEFGFHVIELLERRGNLVHARHILIKPEVTDEDLDKAKAKLDSVRLSIQNGEMDFSTAVRRFGEKKVPSYNNDGRMANPRSGNTFFEIADLESDVFFAIDELKEGGIAKPILYKAPDGTRYYQLLMLSSRSKPHKADLRQDYGKIQKAALEQKKSEYTERWVMERIKATFLSVNDIYQDCPNIKQLFEVKQ
jgi:peptidyl-prolyl cis-trans isomerase SurA